ncbi:MAG: hypothetical protein ACRDP1_06750, partial [Nocardioidaceae bacterium]
MDTHSGFAVWCPRCDWNVAPTGRSPEPASGLSALQRRLVDAIAERLVSDVASSTRGPATPGGGLAVAGTLLALPVNLVTAVAAVGGRAFLVGGVNWPERIAGGALLLVAVATRPRLPGRPP